MCLFWSKYCVEDPDPDPRPGNFQISSGTYSATKKIPDPDLDPWYLTYRVKCHIPIIKQLVTFLLWNIMEHLSAGDWAGQHPHDGWQRGHGGRKEGGRGRGDTDQALPRAQVLLGQRGDSFFPLFLYSEAEFLDKWLESFTPCDSQSFFWWRILR